MPRRSGAYARRRPAGSLAPNELRLGKPCEGCRRQPREKSFENCSRRLHVEFTAAGSLLRSCEIGLNLLPRFVEQSDHIRDGGFRTVVIHNQRRSSE